MGRKGAVAIPVAWLVLVALPSVVDAKVLGLPVLSLSVSTPRKVTLSGGYACLFDPKDNRDWVKGMVVRIEPGVAGIKGHMGACFIGRNRWDRLFCSATLSARRTYGHPWGVEGAQSCLGGELAASLFPLLRINGGVYRNVSPDEGKDWLPSLGLGTGF